MLMLTSVDCSNMKLTLLLTLLALVLAMSSS